MAEAVSLGNLKIWEESVADPACTGMGTTVTALSLDGKSRA
jgi:hypothetical protein